MAPALGTALRGLSPTASWRKCRHGFKGHLPGKLRCSPGGAGCWGFPPRRGPSRPRRCWGGCFGALPRCSSSFEAFGDKVFYLLFFFKVGTSWCQEVAEGQ